MSNSTWCSRGQEQAVAARQSSSSRPTGFAAAAASAADHDDLAACRLDAGECLNVGAVRHDQKISAAGPFVDHRARTRRQGFALVAQHDHIAECRLGFDRSQLQQRCGVDAAAPRRGEDLLRAQSLPTSAARRSVCASARPLALRLRWVAQSSSLKPGGSPTPPGASACRISATCRPARSADQASASPARRCRAAAQSPSRTARMAKPMRRMAANLVTYTRSDARRRRRRATAAATPAR